MDRNSITNQEIKRKFVQREVLLLMSGIVEEALQAGILNYEDIENYYTYPEYYGDYAKFSGGTSEQVDEEIERLTELLYEYEDNEETHFDGSEIREKIEAEIDELQRLESEPQEIFEWWAVTDYLAEKLQQRGHPTLDWHHLTLWGRCTTGQAILLDSVISDICEEMEILEGQSNSWAENK
jgi:hypothetical protein